jgi:RNase P subunit RPR2
MYTRVYCEKCGQELTHIIKENKDDEKMNEQKWTGYGKYFQRPAEIDAIMKMGKTEITPKTPRHCCEKCGYELIESKKQLNKGFNNIGRKIVAYKYYWDCPNGNRLLSMGHTHLSSEENDYGRAHILAKWNKQGGLSDEDRANWGYPPSSN